MAVRELAIRNSFAVWHERRALAHGVVQHSPNCAMQARGFGIR
jgi:hypothetical protein